MKNELLKEIDAFLARHRKTDSWLGETVFNDKSFVRDLRGTRQPRIDTVETLRKWMREQDAVLQNGDA